MTEFYKELLQKNIFTNDIISNSISFGTILDLKRFERLFFEKPIDKDGVFYPYEFFTMAQSLLYGLEINANMGFLYIYICFLEKAYEDFRLRGMDEDIFYDTVKRLAEALQEYKGETGKDGIYDYRFIANHIRGNILRLGVFEYSLGVYENKKVIFMHVPNGADINKRYESYKKAKDYFGKYPIILDSWLLYPEHKKMLSESSNICRLIDDFDIIKVHEHYDYNELFHIFGRDGKIKTNTTLQKKYAERVENKKPVGSAIGILKSLEKSDEK